MATIPAHPSRPAAGRPMCRRTGSGWFPSTGLAPYIRVVYSGMRFLALALGSCIAMSSTSCTRAPEPAPAGITSGYVHGAYNFAGHVVVSRGRYEQTTTFSGETSPTSFTFRWRSTPTDLGGTLAVGPSACALVVDGEQKPRRGEPDELVMAAAGLTSGSARIMHGLWSGRFGEVLPATIDSVETTGSRTTVTGDGGTAYVKTVVVEDGEVRTVTVVGDTARIPDIIPNYSDVEIDHILAATRRPVTAEERASLKATLETVHAHQRQDQGPTIWATTISVTGLEGVR